MKEEAKARVARMAARRVGRVATREGTRVDAEV